MSSESLLKDKTVLIVDDEPDVLEAISELLDMCHLSTAQDYDTAVQLLASYTFDIVILDIMGVDGFKLLKKWELWLIFKLQLYSCVLAPVRGRLSGSAMA